MTSTLVPNIGAMQVFFMTNSFGTTRTGDVKMTTLAVSEMWKEVKGTSYSVSSKGRVRNSTGLILKGWLSFYGYRHVDLGKYIRKSVHVLVAKAFLPPPSFAGAEPNHKDGNKDNNDINNLEWMTRAENITHAYEIGLRVYMQPSSDLLSNPGEKNGRSLLTWKKVRKIRLLRGRGETIEQIAEKYPEVSYSAIKKVCANTTWKEEK